MDTADKRARGLMAHGDSRKLQALKALTTLLAGVTPANGHDFDLTGKVYRGRGLFGAEQSVPFVSIVEPDRSDPAAELAGQQRKVRLEWWALLVQGWATGDAENPTDVLYNLMAAVESRVALLLDPADNAFRLGGLVADTRIGPGYIPAEMPNAAICFYLPIELRIGMNVADPWAVSTKL